MAYWQKNQMEGYNVSVSRVVRHLFDKHNTVECVFIGLYHTPEEAEKAASYLQRYINGCWPGDLVLPHYLVFAGDELQGIMTVKNALDLWANRNDPNLQLDLFDLSNPPALWNHRCSGS